MKNTCPFGHCCEKRDEHGDVSERCRLFVRILGINPQTGQEVDEWGCSLAFTPLLLTEVGSQTRQAGAAIESFRNEVKSDNREFLSLIQIARVSHAPDD